VAKKRGVFKRGRGRKATWWARLVFVDENGKRHDLQRRADSEAHAVELRRRLEEEYWKDSGRTLTAAVRTFGELADYYEEHYARPPEYDPISGRKVVGLRSWRSQRSYLSHLRAYFGERKLRSITHAALQEYCRARLGMKTRRTGVAPTLATLNRELSCLRGMFSIAVQEGWMFANPFAGGRRLISTAEERRGQRVISPEEERLLLAAARDRWPHLYRLLVAALDLGGRKSELLRLTWADVDFTTGDVSLLTTKTKVPFRRQVRMTPRLRSLLLAAREEALAALPAGERPDEYCVFCTRAPSKKPMDNFKRSWAALTRGTGLDLDFRDCRRTFGTRLNERGLPSEMVQRLLGHTTSVVTYKHYLQATDETRERAAELLGGYADSPDGQATAETVH
jgi:integrase